MESMAIATTKKHRTSVPIELRNRQIMSFKNPGILEYRNAVILMLLHTSFLLNWAQEIHPARHKCDTSDMNLLCAFYSLATSYWHGDISQDTHNTRMVRVWAKLCNATWTAGDVYRRQGPWRFMEAYFRQPGEGLKDKDGRIKDPQHFFRGRSQNTSNT
ncbi:uncharacterized protein APUU_41212A [Aspergillus puulaauensis]|uniref:Uncharacterized protein n=1 Tax=Aspergillus puulaauensis TaxID=1220207 RepID=A0A7R7XPV8_9EURO|nr:uncharacterized protein APUU_41212A [Aspergillus puulaauensis]BCS24768.1 hypothetical protein APUU_41212A [Aspergillus puulaauensis]